jgi:hypothetical protein
MHQTALRNAVTLRKGENPMKMTHIVIAALSLVSASAQADTISIGVNPLAQTVQPGGSFSVAIGIAGLGDGIAPSIGTFDLDLTYDASLLTYSGVTFGDPVLGDQLDLFGLGSLTDVGGASPGVLNLFELSFDLATDLDDLQADAFTLATVIFDALSPGTSTLGLSLNELGDANGVSLDAHLSGASVSVVPLPASLIAFASGLGLLISLGRLKR